MHNGDEYMAAAGLCQQQESQLTEQFPSGTNFAAIPEQGRWTLIDNCIESGVAT